jgi:hypothetical protein
VYFSGVPATASCDAPYEVLTTDGLGYVEIPGGIIDTCQQTNSYEWNNKHNEIPDYVLCIPSQNEARLVTVTVESSSSDYEPVIIASSSCDVVIYPEYDEVSSQPGG